MISPPTFPSLAPSSAVTPGTTALVGTIDTDLDVAGTGPYGSLVIVADAPPDFTLPTDYASGFTTYTRLETYKTGISAPPWPTSNDVAIWEPVDDIRGVILWLQGGGFTLTDWEDGPNDHQWPLRQVARGCVLVSVEYRVTLPLNVHYWDEGREDIGDALTWAEAEYPGKPIVVMGHSAGGFYALHLAAEEGLPVVAFAGWTDWDQYQDPTPDTESGFASLARSFLFSGGTPVAAADVDLDTVGPTSVYLVAGDDDDQISPWSSRTTADALNERHIVTYLDIAQGPPTGAGYTDHAPWFGCNANALDAFVDLYITTYGYHSIPSGGALATDADVAGTVTAPAPGPTDLAGALTLDVDVAGVGPDPLLTGEGATDVDVAGTLTAPAPSPTAVAGALTADVDVAGTLTAPPASAYLVGAIEADLDVAGTLTAPAPDATELVGAIIPDALVDGTVTAPAPDPADVVGAIDLDVDVAGGPSAPPADATLLVGTIEAGVLVEGTATAPAPDPAEVVGSIGLDLDVAGTTTAPAPDASDVVGAGPRRPGRRHPDGTARRRSLGG